jgi:hypothetical protein
MRTSGWSSSSTLLEGHEDRYKSRHKVNMTPRGPRTNLWRQKTPTTWTQNAEACTIRSPIQTTQRNWRQGPTCNWEKVLEDARSSPAKNGANRAKKALGRSAWPVFGPPFDPDASRTIYSPPAKSHASIHSSSTTEEQRREGHHSGEERVKMVD